MFDKNQPNQTQNTTQDDSANNTQPEAEKTNSKPEDSQDLKASEDRSISTSDEGAINTSQTQSDSQTDPKQIGADFQSVVTSPHVPQKYGGKKVIATIFGIFLLVGGVALGVILVQRQQQIAQKASTGLGSGIQTSAVCSGVKAYDINWNPLTNTQLSNLKSGSVVRFAVSGTISEGTIDSARFTINNDQRNPVTTKKPGSDEFYDEYIIPANTYSFTVKGEVHNSTVGWF